MGILDAAHGALAAAIKGTEDSGAPEDQTYDLIGRLKEALATVSANLAAVLGSWADPLGLAAVRELKYPQAAAQSLAVSQDTSGAMAEPFGRPAGAFAYLQLILLYMPRMAAFETVQNKAGSG